ncbi:MAG TPA: hypothetical protein DEB40_09825 [Elusimicrobia bacterium]|nr:hypothetical protein [Elusimicrobiota bacterium]HBT62028.1 hypothetical protein [Elusimicrobiota bacterium]
MKAPPRRPIEKLPSMDLALLLPLPLTVVLIAAWMALVACGYKGTLRILPQFLASLAQVLAEILPRIGPSLAGTVLWLAGLWVLAAALGACWLRWLELASTRAEGLLLACALGFGTLSLGLLGYASLGAYSPAVLKTTFFPAAAAALISSRWWWSWLPNENSPREGRISLWETAALFLLALAALMSAVMTFCPEIFYDALVYHLALPKLYLLKGRLTAIPHNIFSGLPLGLQMIYGLVLALSDERLARLLHASLGLAAAGAVYCVGRRCISRPAGIFAALAFLACPVALYASWNSGVDLATSFYGSTAFLALMRDLFPDKNQAGTRPGWPLACGALLGFACGTKYNMLPIAAVLIGIHAWHSRRQGRPWRATWLLLAAFAASFSPWLVKNLFLFSNPLYPFLRGLFPDAGWVADWQAFLDASGSRHVALAGAAGWKELLLQPWTTSVGSWPMGDWPGPVYLTLLPWLFLLRPRRPAVAAVLAAAAGSYLCWLFASRLVRYLLPAFPWLALAAALAVENNALPRWLRRAGWLAALYGGLFNIQVAFSQANAMGQWQFLMGRVSRENYLNTQRPTYPLPYFAAAEFINRRLPADARILLLGESRTFYIDRDCLAATVFDRNPFWLQAENARDARDLLSRVRGLGVTHIFLSVPPMASQGNSPGLLPREIARRAAFAEFWGKYLKKIFEQRQDIPGNPRWLLVYEIVSEPNAPSALTPNPISEILPRLESLGRG